MAQSHVSETWGGVYGHVIGGWDRSALYLSQAVGWMRYFRCVCAIARLLLNGNKDAAVELL